MTFPPLKAQIHLLQVGCNQTVVQQRAVMNVRVHFFGCGMEKMEVSAG
jgi:hypothetical protein